jgi:hypothetical protein
VHCVWRRFADFDARLAQFFEQRMNMLGDAARHRTSPPVIAAATTNVPASMRSLMMVCSSPPSFSTP